LAAVESPAQNAMNVGNLPLFFEAGQGPADAMAAFIAHGPNSEFLISPTGAQFVLRKTSGQTAATRMQFLGANPAAQVAGDAELSGKVNYLVGDNPAQWQSAIPTFAKVRVEGIYPGVSVVYYGNGRQLEYDFDLAAGVDPKTIAIHFDGAEKISVDTQGELVVSLNGGEIIQHRPVVYQGAGATRQEIAGGYQLLDDHTATFALGRYDHLLPLVIDPILSFSTYFGGNYGDIIHAIALDKNGNIYVTGETLSTKFTNSVSGNAPSGYQPVFQGTGLGGVGDAFVAKFDNLGSNFIYFTYLGGSADDAAYGLAVDNSGNAYVTGTTTSPNFPTKNALFGNLSPIIHLYTTDAFVTELNTNGSGLVYSTYLGGDSSDIGKAIAVDSNGTAYVAGYTYSTNFPVTVKSGVSTAAYQSHLLCTNSLYINANAFLAAIAPGGTNLNYSSYFGGTNFDEATAVAVDSSNFIYVAGFTASTNFPTKNPLPKNGHLDGALTPIPAFDAFVAKFQPGYTNLVYSTFLGGTNSDAATGIAAQNGNAYVVGWTTSTNFPCTSVSTNFASFVRTNGAYYSYYVVATNSFLTEITNSTTASGIGFSVMFGGYGVDVANGVALDATGNIFVVGSATSTNYPTTPANLFGSLSPTNSGYNVLLTPTSDVVISAFNTNASALLYSAYLGGSGYPYLYAGGNDFGNAIAVDPAGNAYIVGQTWSTNFPTVNARQTFLAGTNDAFIAKILLATMPPLSAGRAAPNVQVFWPSIGQANTNYIGLQTTTNLPTTNWVFTAQLPVLTNGNIVYYFNPTNPARFFRLHKH